MRVLPDLALGVVEAQADSTLRDCSSREGGLGARERDRPIGANASRRTLHVERVILPMERQDPLLGLLVCARSLGLADLPALRPFAEQGPVGLQLSRCGRIGLQFLGQLGVA